MRFVSGDQTLNSVAAFLSLENTEIALAVAFWGGDALERLGVAEWRAEKVRVICNALSGACNPQALIGLKSRVGANLRTNARLHAKVYWTPGKLIITSANASASGLSLEDREVEGNIEAGVESTSQELLKPAKKWFDNVFESEETVEVDDNVIARAEQMWKARRRPVEPMDSKPTNATPPAQLLAPVKQHWIEQAFDAFARLNRERIYFGTDSNHMFNRPRSIETVFFKPLRNNYVTAMATYIDIITTIPPQNVLLSGRVTRNYEFWYGFNNLRKLPVPIPLSSLRYYANGNPVLNTVPGCCFVKFMTDAAR
jgi:hypothetical protein